MASVQSEKKLPNSYYHKEHAVFDSVFLRNRHDKPIMMVFFFNLICGLGFKIALSILKEDSWIRTPYANEAAQRYITFVINEDGNVSVKRYSHNDPKRPENAILVEKLTDEDFKIFADYDVIPEKLFVALCFSVDANKGPIETFMELKAKQRLVKSNASSAFTSHMVWLIINSWNVVAIRADEVFQLMCDLLNWNDEQQKSFIAALSLEAFYADDNSTTKAYREIYEAFFDGKIDTMLLTSGVDLEIVRKNLILDLERYKSITALIA
jgi:hypothetical protein